MSDPRDPREPPLRPTRPLAATRRPRGSAPPPAGRRPAASRPPGAQPSAPHSGASQSGASRSPAASRPGASAEQDAARAARAAARRNKLVLVVEDDEKTRKLVGHVVKKGGYRVVLAPDGLRAAAVLKKARPDLILLDIRMPRMDGFKLLELLARFETAASIPVVMLTASDSPLDLDRALRLGVQDYLVKPISPKALLLKVRALLR